MRTLVGNLRAFNRKERFFLVGQALGTPDFSISPYFRGRLDQLLDRRVPANAYCAMDYHLDWLYAALCWTYEGVQVGDHVERPNEDVHPKTSERTNLKITGNQSDTDLLVAWEDDRGTGQIVLIEAKGFTPWDPAQMKYKAARLNAIFGDREPKFPDVQARLVLASFGSAPEGLPVEQWPGWARNEDTSGARYFLSLDPPSDDVFAVERIDVTENIAKPSATGDHWRIKPSTWPGLPKHLKAAGS